MPVAGYLRRELVPMVTYTDLFTFVIMLCAVITLASRKNRDYPKDCVNLQTDVRYNYTVWRYYYGKKKRQPTKSCNETNDV